LDLSQLSKNDILYIGFNQDQSCFAVGCRTGFRVYNCSPFKETFSRELEGGGIRHVEMLFRCNIFALVGAANNGRFPPNKVIIWDDQRRKDIGELSFRHEVKSVRLRRDKVVVVIEYKVLVYKFSDLVCTHEIDTVSNLKGLCALSPSSHQTVLACPGSHKGHVRVELFEARRTNKIEAHASHLSCLALNLDGSRLVTASEKGTILRVFDTHSGKPLQEVRRGAQAAQISSLSFNPTSTLLSCSSIRGTVHIFSISEDDAVRQTPDGGPPESAPKGGEEGPSSHTSNSRSSLAVLGGMVHYFSSQWSFAKFRVPETDALTVSCFSGEANQVMVLTSTGHIHTCSFDPDGAPGQDARATNTVSFLEQDKGQAGATDTAAAVEDDD